MIDAKYGAVKYVKSGTVEGQLSVRLIAVWLFDARQQPQNKLIASEKILSYNPHKRYLFSAFCSIDWFSITQSKGSD